MASPASFGRLAESEDDGGAFTTADLAGDLAAVLDAVGCDRADVLGAFLGGMVAQEFALAWPERVDRLAREYTAARDRLGLAV